jgi:PAS domain S-box-containing protein
MPQPLIQVLVVDDESETCVLTKQFLELSKKLEVDTVCSAREATTEIKKKHYDVIVSDYQMPEEDGIQFLRALRAAGNSTPFILFTGKGREEVVIAALNSGADSYLQKGGKATPQYAELEHGILAVVQRYRAKEALLESEARFAQLTEYGGIVIWEIDSDGLFTYVSGASKTVWGGYQPEELIGKKRFYDLIPESDRDSFKAMIFEKIKGRERFVNMENPILTKDGRVRWVSTNGIPFMDEDGKVRGYRGSDIDITERKRAESTLWMIAARNDAILAAIPDIMTEVDNQKRIKWVNQPGLDFFGEDVIGHEASYYFEGHQETYNTVQPVFDGSDEIIHLESWQRRKDGKKRLLSWNCKKLSDEEGRVTGALSSARDITDRERTEQEREVVRAIGEVINKNASLDEILQVIHDNIKKVMYAENCYIALWDSGTGLMSFPFFVDKNDPKLAARVNCKGLTEYVLETAQPLLLTPESLEVLEREHEVEIIGTRPESWLGVPLSFQSKKIGVLVVQSYEPGNNYTDAEKDLLTTIGNQAAAVIERKRAEDALQQSEQRYRLLVNSAAEAIVVAQDGMLRLVNPVTVAMIGHSEQELMSKPFSEFIHPGDRAMVVGNYQKRMRGEAVPDRYTFRFQAKDGSAKWVELSAVMIEWEGRPASLNFLTDINERKRTEEALQTSKRELADIIDFLPDATFVIDLEGKVVAWNKAIERMTGVSKEHMIGQGNNAYSLPFYGFRRAMLLDRLQLRDEEIDQNYENIIKKGNTLFAEAFCNALRDGKGEHVWATATSLFDDQGNRVGAIESIRDITEDKRIEMELKESEAFHRQLMSNVSSGVVIIDPETRMIETANEAAAVLFGTAKENIVGHRCHSYLCPALEGACPVCDQGQEVDNADRVMLCADGGKRPILKTVKRTNIRGKEKLLECFVDITDRKHAEEALRQANIKLGILNNVTRHDISNQIMVVNGLIELVRQKHVNNPSMSQFLDKLSRAASNVQRQIAFTKDYQGLGIETPTWISVGRQITDAFEMLRPPGAILDDMVEHVELLTDPLAEKVFYNLVDNSIRHGGHVTRIKMSNKPVGDAMSIIYEDDGVGISEEYRKHLFEKGFGKNSGYGLFLIREILAITGITITEKGQAGKGVRFEMLVPPGAWRRTAV